MDKKKKTPIFDVPEFRNRTHVFLDRKGAGRVLATLLGSYRESDAIVLAFIESELLFGMGMAHGFSPTTKRTLITRATGHIVHELDDRPLFLATEDSAFITGQMIVHDGGLSLY